MANVKKLNVLDIRSCCIRNGMTHRNCVDKMCDPKKTDSTQIPDLMVLSLNKAQIINENKVEITFEYILNIFLRCVHHGQT